MRCGPVTNQGKGYPFEVSVTPIRWQGHGGCSGEPSAMTRLALARRLGARQYRHGRGYRLPSPNFGPHRGPFQRQAMLVLRRHLGQQVVEAFARRFHDQPTLFGPQFKTLADLHACVLQSRRGYAHGGTVSPLLNFNAHNHFHRRRLPRCVLWT